MLEPADHQPTHAPVDVRQGVVPELFCCGIENGSLWDVQDLLTNVSDVLQVVNFKSELKLHRVHSVAERGGWSTCSTVITPDALSASSPASGE